MRGKLSRRSLTRRELALWYEWDCGHRLARDGELIAKHYPQLHFNVDPKTGLMRLEGNLIYTLACNVPTQVPVRLVLPYDYPNHKPNAYDVENLFPHEADRHFYPSGRCCLWLPLESKWIPTDANSLIHFVDQVSIFFDRQFVYDAQPAHQPRRWPGGERGHGLDGYLEYVRDILNGDEGVIAALVPILQERKGVGRNRKCPCGSNRKYKICHMT